MIQIQKNNKKPLAIIITAAVLAVLLVSLIVLDTLIRGGFLTGPENNTPTTEPIEIIEGEALHNGTIPLIYPATSSEKILGFSVESDNGYFAAKRPNAESGLFIYYYKDEKGTEQVYFPPICYNESDFDYTDMYAISDDGMNTHKLTYVLVAVAMMQFNERIELNSDVTGEYDSQLAFYGLDPEHRESITFTCLDENDKEVTRTIYIGNRIVSGIGYYVQLEGRSNCVYVATGAENIKYALEGFESFVNPRLIMGGNPTSTDTTAEPLLTTGYKQWKNVIYDGKDEWGNDKPTPDRVVANSTVVFNVDILTSIYKNSDDTDKVNTDGYVHSGYNTIQVDLETVADRAPFQRFINTIVGKAVGDYTNKEIVASVVYNTNSVTLTEGKSQVYTYNISEIESVITDTEEYTSGPVGDAKLVKVIYSCYIDGKVPVYGEEKLPFEEELHAVIDLTDQRIPEAVRQYLSSSEVGALDEVQSFDITYTAENANKSVSQYVIKDITLINEIINDQFVVTDKITENSIVTYTYNLISDGVIIDEGKQIVPFYEINEESDEYLQAMKTALIGKGTEKGIDLKVYEQVEYNQLFMNFATYKIKSIDMFITKELISAYKFVNPDDRDPFRGESIHNNDLPQNHKYYSYAVDSQSCEYVSKVLGGLMIGASSTIFEGLVGEKVVAVGLTPANMKKYGLYAYTISFGLPRGLFEVGEDYQWLDTVDTTLYISEPNSDGKRYVGSDMYDIVVEMDAEVLFWVEESFIDFWARRDMAMVHHTKLDKLSATVNMEGFKGKYDFTVRHPDAWITANGLTFVEPEGDKKEKYNALSVSVSVSGERTDSKLNQYLEAFGTNSIELSVVYNLAAGIVDGNGLVDGYDTLGDSAFKYFLSVLYSTGYMGRISEEDAAQAMSSSPELTLTFEVGESSGYEYGYDFYYTNDGRVAVSLYRLDTSNGNHIGESCDFYISNFGFKKILYALSDLINGEIIDPEEGYRDQQ